MPRSLIQRAGRRPFPVPTQWHSVAYLQLRIELFPRAPMALCSCEILLYQFSDDLSEVLIYLMVVFSPWAFGATQEWAIRTMNVGGYILGLALAIKLFIRNVRGYHPPRWDTKGAMRDKALNADRSPCWSIFNCSTWLAFFTLNILVYCLLSALNARSTYQRLQFSFDYHNYLPWLPHSFDSHNSWLAFWNFLALACAFWAIRDWLLGKTPGEEEAEYQDHKRAHEVSVVRLTDASVPAQETRSTSLARSRANVAYLPARLRRLLWLLCLNGGLLGIESIIQRLSGSGKLLWLVEPTINRDAESQLGPYAYRSNGAQYFNLLWPVCLGFWWMLHRSGGFQRNQHHWLLGCGVAMAVSSIISLSRGGALVAVSILVLAAFYLLTTHYLFSAPKDQRLRRGTAAVLFIFFSTALMFGFILGWKRLQPRLEEIGLGYDQRQEMYELARPMADHYPWFGTGPGTFEPLFQFYRPTLDTYWPAQLHNDWLETRITFGWIGSALIAGALVTVLLRWFFRGGIHGGRRFVILFWLALAGCLAHARFDFPFQIYSILFLFLVLCAILSNLSRRPG